MENTMNKATQSLQSVNQICQNIFSIRYLSKTDDQIRLQQEMEEYTRSQQDILIQEQLKEQQLQKEQQQKQYKIIQEEQELRQQQQQALKQEQEKKILIAEQQLKDFTNQFSTLFLLTPHQQLSALLLRYVMMDFIKSPSIEYVTKYTKDQFQYFGERLRDFEKSDKRGYMVLVETSCHITGAYYPEKAAGKQNLLFAADCERHELVPTLGEFQYAIKLRTSSRDVYEVLLKQDSLEYRKDGTITCWFCGKNTKEELKYMNIITFNK